MNVHIKSANNPDFVAYRVTKDSPPTHMHAAGVLMPDDLHRALSQRAKNEGYEGVVLQPTRKGNHRDSVSMITLSGTVLEDRSILNDTSEVGPDDSRWEYVTGFSKDFLPKYLDTVRSWWTREEEFLELMGVEPIFCQTPQQMSMRWRMAAEKNHPAIVMPTSRGALDRMLDALRDDIREGVWPGGNQLMLVPTSHNGDILCNDLIDGI